MIESNTNPTREFLHEQTFKRSWAWLVKNGHVEDGDDAYDFAHEWLRRAGWPVPSAALLLDIHVRYTGLRRAKGLQAWLDAHEAQPA